SAAQRGPRGSPEGRIILQIGDQQGSQSAGIVADLVGHGVPRRPDPQGEAALRQALVDALLGLRGPEVDDLALGLGDRGVLGGALAELVALRFRRRVVRYFDVDRDQYVGARTGDLTGNAGDL